MHQHASLDGLSGPAWSLLCLLGDCCIGGRSERLLGACPAAADAMQLSHRDSLRPRRLRRGERLEPFRAVLVAPADAILGGGSASGGSGEEAEDAAENDAPRRAAAAPGPDAWAGVVPDRPTAAEEVLHKRRVKRQLDREEDVARYVGAMEQGGCMCLGLRWRTWVC
jgi:hypothetical protein